MAIAPEQLFGPQTGVQDHYPVDEEKHQLMVSIIDHWFRAAESGRQGHYDRWVRYYRLVRNFIERDPRDWRSKVFMPIPFFVVETILPRLVAEVPTFIVKPLPGTPELAGRALETLMQWAAQNSNLYGALIDAMKSALTFGTGIMKCGWTKDEVVGRMPVTTQVQLMETIQQAVMDPDTGEREYDLSGMPMFEDVQVPTDEMVEETFFQPQPVVKYEGPLAEAVDLFQFFVAPEATSIEDARYTIQRYYRSWEDIDKKIEEGVYRLPSWVTREDLAEMRDEPRFDRDGAIGLWSGDEDITRKPVEVWEVYTSRNKLITVLNKRAILRYTDNPFDHGRKPYVRLVDVQMPHEFYGVGEVEPIEGPVDAINALANQRIDNVKLAMNKMFAVNIHELHDPKDLEWKPGGVIRIATDMPASEVVREVDVTDITNSAFAEVDYLEKMVEKTTGVSPFTMGVETPSVNRTATGASLLNDNTISRFAMKVRLMEDIGLQPLAEMFGSLLQQFLPAEKVMDVAGPDGQILLQSITPESIQGAMDYTVEPASATQSEQMRKDQWMQLIQVAGAFLPQAVLPLFENLLKEYGVKDPERYIAMAQQMMMAEQLGAGAGEPGTQNGQPTGAPPGEPPAPTPEEMAMMQAEMMGGANGPVG